MFTTYRLKPKAMFAPGVGKPLSTEYESVSVQLKKLLTAEIGTLTINATGVTAGQELLFNVAFNRILPNSFQQMCTCDMSDVIRLVMPAPLPASPANWIATNLRIQPAIASWVTTTVVNNIITYTFIRPGYQLAINSQPANVITQAITTQASNGMIPNVGDGGAIFYKPQDNNMLPGIKSYFGYAGFANISETPTFMGVKRAYDKIQNECDPVLLASYVKEDCCEVIRRGTVHVPLEVMSPATLPGRDVLGISTRYAADGSFTRTGGFRIVDSSVALAAGTLLIPSQKVELMAVNPTRTTALIRLI